MTLLKQLIINGGKPLSGSVKISGAKNAALPILAASVVTDEEVMLENVPNLSDIITMKELLSNFGAELEEIGDSSLRIDPSKISNTEAPYDIVRKMRASFITLGGILAKYGEAKVSLPGGCAIGARPVDFHLEALRKMGADIVLREGYVFAAARGGKLKGANIELPFASVGATQNILIAATLAKGETVIENAAREPEIDDLANMLSSMGAEIEGVGTSKLVIQGKEKLSGTKHSIIADRIEAGTYLSIAACTKGEVEVMGVNADTMRSTLKAFTDMGLEIQEGDKSIKAKFVGNLTPANMKTEPHPGFPTDMQAQLVAIKCLAQGNSTMQENIFENRFMHIPELQRMGADIEVSGNLLKINGIERFTPAEVMATDLRASVSLILAALNANGTSKINRIYHLERGYENIVEKLSSLGADVEMKTVES